MPLGFWFWLLWVVWFIFGGWFVWWPQGRYYVGSSTLLCVLVAILGWKVFGAPWSTLVR